MPAHAHPARPRDHARLAAWLHLVSAVLLLVLLALGLAGIAASYAQATGLAEDLKGRLGTLALVVGTAVSVLAGLELLGGVALLSGKAIGRPLLLLCSALQVINLPFGTALAAYTFWALARGPAAPAHGG